MAEVTVRMRDDGPLIVEGPIQLLDGAGQGFTLDASKPSVALCRCGQSLRRPFCDGSHRECGFASAERAGG